VPTLYDVSTVHISVTDDNDNRPVFTHPSSLDNDTAVIQLTSSVHVGHVVTQVRASDADIGVNARLSYSIVNDSHDVQLFAIDKESGDVTVAASLPQSSHAVTYNVVIAVSDAGIPSLTSQMTLHILVSEAALHSRSAQAVDIISRRSALYTASSVINITSWIVAGACIAGLLVIFTTLCLLLVVSRKRQRKRRPRTTTTTMTTTATTTTPQTASLSRRKTPAPTPLALMTDVNPLTSAMLRRHQFDDVTLLEQRVGMRTTGECGNYVDYMLQNTPDCADVSCNSAPVSTLPFLPRCNADAV